MILRLFILFLSFSFVACSHIEQRRNNERGQSTDPSQHTESGTEPETGVEPPPLLKENTDKVAVVLGPGAAKTLAYPAVLKAFHDNRVPIHRIVGIEWGALTAGLYALSGKPHEVEWKVYKLDPKALDSSGFFKSSSSVQVKALTSYLKANFGNARISELTLPFVCPTLSLRKGSVSFRASSRVWKSVQNCLSTPPSVEPSSDKVPALFAFEEIVKSLRNSGMDKVIFINALGDRQLFGSADKEMRWSDKLLWLEVRRQIWSVRSLFDDYVSLDTNGFSITDFTVKKELSQVGQVSGRKAAKTIARKYGY